MNCFSHFPYPIAKGTELLAYCKAEGKSVSEIVWENEKALHTEKKIDDKIKAIWQVMLESMYEGCHTEGTLPGGLNVHRRAFDTHKKLVGNAKYTNTEEWVEGIRNTEVKFRQNFKMGFLFCFSCK